MPVKESRAQILKSARRAFAGSAEPTMEEMAASASVSLRTLYRLFGTREGLLEALRRSPPPSARQRVLEAALDLVGKEGLAQLSMDDLAIASKVSRATLYRLFPGKPALFKALVEAYSPWEPVADLLEKRKEEPASAVVPELARVLARALEGRTGVLLRMVLEMVKGEPDTIEGVRHSMSRGLPDLIQYLSRQMKERRLRRMHPVLAFQLLAGPIVVHVATRPLAAIIGFRVSTEAVVDQIARAWLRAMTPA